MKFVRFTSESTVKMGVLSTEGIKEISGDLFSTWHYTGETFLLNEVTILAPIEPKQLIGIGANFVKSKEDLPSHPPEMPVFFFKPASSVIGPDDTIKIPADIDSVKFESEIAVVIGKQAKDIEEHEVSDYIFGFTVGNDVTAPQYFHQDGHWTLGKSFDTFTPLGPVIETNLDVETARIKAVHNGVKKQDSGVDVMIVSISRMISYLSKVMKLQPGDVILTGSPVGAEFLQDGDHIECVVDGIGSLLNSVVQVNQKAKV